MSEVVRLAASPAAPDAPALGFSVQTDLGAGRVCTLQTFLPNDCTQAQLDTMLDKMTRAGDRQRAHYKIEELERERDQMTREQAQHQEDLARIDQDYELAQEKRREAAGKAQTLIDKAQEAAREAHVASGRRGEFALKGNQAQNLNVTRAGIENVVAEMDQAKEAHDVAHANSAKTMQRRAEIIAKIEQDIARCRAIVG